MYLLFSAHFHKVAEDVCAVDGVGSLIFKAHPLRMKLEADDRQGSMFKCFHILIVPKCGGTNTFAQRLQRLMVGAVDIEGGL